MRVVALLSYRRYIAMGAVFTRELSLPCSERIVIAGVGRLEVGQLDC